MGARIQRWAANQKVNNIRPYVILVTQGGKSVLAFQFPGCYGSAQQRPGRGLSAAEGEG